MFFTDYILRVLRRHLQPKLKTIITYFFELSLPGNFAHIQIKLGY